ncbi:hypothetical protein PIB30_069244, partial [Stylosanthes scabra]|nr:hypothetical protein [Stylosanthes scabra]
MSVFTKYPTIFPIGRCVSQSPFARNRFLQELTISVLREKTILLVLKQAVRNRQFLLRPCLSLSVSGTKPQSPLCIKSIVQAGRNHSPCQERSERIINNRIRQ